MEEISRTQGLTTPILTTKLFIPLHSCEGCPSTPPYKTTEQWPAPKRKLRTQTDSAFRSRRFW